MLKDLNLLKNKPQAKSIVKKVVILSPKKPNSARRSTIWAIIFYKRGLYAYIPGIGHSLRKHSIVLIKNKGARDLPGVNYTCVRGVHDLLGVLNRKTRRSIFGKKKK